MPMSVLDSRLVQEAADADNQQQNHRIFQIYHFYRMALSLVLWVSFYYRGATSALGSIDQTLFLQACSVYTVANVLALVFSPLHGKAGANVRVLISFTIIIADILLLALLSYTCGGVSSGLAHLMLVPVATGSILFSTRLGIFLAAIGSIAAMYSEGYLYFVQPRTENYYVQAGLLGMLLFVLSLGLQYLGYRIRHKELINRQQAASIQSLQEINQQIIQRMQTGIVVVSRQGEVLNSNDSARRLLTTNDAARSMTGRLPPELMQQLDDWLAQSGRHNEPFRIAPGAAELLAHFSFLQTQSDPNILIFLEDYSQLSSRAQHLKLMSLGRLSASIAHEIRNPLGAISHACQLLGESQHSTAEDQRLITIINTHTQRVNNIIESILEHSRQRQQMPDLISLEAWLEQFVARFRNSYPRTVACELVLQQPTLQLSFNAGQLEQLLTNLCGNAIRHSEKATGSCWVRITAGQQAASGNPFIDVCDCGPGVPAECADQIFEPFFTTESSGTGLGLFICKEICEANQARIHYTRNQDGLSCFRIQFPHPDRNIS
jgi:two-component system sensor histidine kinase PilS (NtrC family)